MQQIKREGSIQGEGGLYKNKNSYSLSKVAKQWRYIPLFTRNALKAITDIYKVNTFLVSIALNLIIVRLYNPTWGLA